MKFAVYDGNGVPGRVSVDVRQDESKDTDMGMCAPVVTAVVFAVVCC